MDPGLRDPGPRVPGLRDPGPRVPGLRDPGPGAQGGLRDPGPGTQGGALLEKSVKRKIRYHVESLPAADNGLPTGCDFWKLRFPGFRPKIVFFFIVKSIFLS